MRKTLHGYKQPRLLYLNNTTPISLGSKVVEVGDGFIRFASNIPSTVTANMAIYGNNYDDKETWGRIKSISGDKVYHTGFSFAEPKLDSLCDAKYTVYDLPFSQTPLIEEYAPDFIVHQLYNGTRDTNIRGWWYSASLDYGKKMDPEKLVYFDPLFDSSRTYDVRFYPRYDNYAVYYTVEPDPNTRIQLAHKPFWNGHKFFRLKLNGTTRLSSINLTPTQFGIITESGDILTDEDGTVITP